MAPGHFRYNSQPAATIVKTLGGVRAVAKFLNLSPEWVSKWCRPPEKNGTGGFISLPYWEPLLRWAYDRELDHIVNRRLFYTGMKRRMSVGSASKVKGDRFEYQVVHEIYDAGFDAHRVPLSGAVAGYPGDVKVTTLERDWLIQCKITGKHNAGGRGVVLRVLREVSIGAIFTPKGTYVAMRRDLFFGLLRGERPRIVNMPLVSTTGELINKDIRSHDALVFRQSGVKDWFVLVTEKTYGVEL